MKHRLATLLLLVVPLVGPLDAQAVTGGMAFGPTGEAAPNRLAWVSSDLILIQTGLAGLSLAPFSLGLSVNPEPLRAVWGQLATEWEGWAATGGALALTTPTWDLWVTPFRVELQPELAWTRWLTFGNQPWKAGLIEASASGTLLYLEDVDIGALSGRAGAVFGTWGWGGLFYAQASVKIDSRVDLFVITPFHYQGRGVFHAVGGWVEARAQAGPWEGSVLAGLAQAWSTSQRFTLVTETLDSLELPATVVRESLAWTLELKPAWATLVRPGFRFGDDRHLGIEIARWLPLLGGWSVRQEPAPSSGGQGGGSKAPQNLWDQLQALDPWDLWVAGLQVSVMLRY